MKPAPFVYLRPQHLDELIEMLAATTATGKLLAGGQSLIPMLNMRLARPGHLIDMNFVDGLDEIEDTGTALRLGTMVRQRDAEISSIVAEHAPLMIEALQNVAHVQIRHRGTVGGNLAHADPASELPAVARALEATFIARGPQGKRQIPASDFFVGIFTTALQPEEVLTHVEIPYSPNGMGWAFEEFARRRGDFAIVGVAAGVRLQDEVIQDARLALAGAASTPVRCTEAEELLRGQPADPSTFQAAARAAIEELSPAPDLEASTEYRIALIETLVTRALARASGRAG